MNFFKKIDNYLLHYYPSLWVTRVHSFLPIGLGLVLLIYVVNISFGWNPKDSLSSEEWPILLMIIPVLIYLVYWFIFQSRYSVEKSGGKTSYWNNYLNFILYSLVFSVAYLFILVIPFSNDHKLTNAVSLEEVKKDILNLNMGNAIVNYSGSFEDVGNGHFDVWNSEFIYDYYDSYDSDEYADNSSETITKRQALQRIENYVDSYNKYVRNEITKSPSEILAGRLSGEDTYDDDYYYYDYYDSDWTVSQKLERIRDLHLGQGYSMWSEPWFWRISFAFIAWLALLVWIFKQMNLRHFVFGFITICLTPLVAAIVAGILFGLIYSYSSGDDAAQFAFTLVLILYVCVGIVFIRGYLENKLNQTAYVMSMYFHFWLPILPLFIYGMFLINRDYRYYGYRDEIVGGLTEEEIIYWICVGFGVASIAVFKPIYAKFRSLPMRK